MKPRSPSKSCPGYRCLTRIPVGRDLCHFCTRGPARPLFTDQPGDGPEPIAAVITRFEEELPTCPCGGLADGEHHESSLLHQRYAMAQLGPAGPMPQWRRFLSR